MHRLNLRPSLHLAMKALELSSRRSWAPLKTLPLRGHHTSPNQLCLFPMSPSIPPISRLALGNADALRLAAGHLRGLAARTSDSHSARGLRSAAAVHRRIAASTSGVNPLALRSRPLTGLLQRPVPAQHSLGCPQTLTSPSPAPARSRSTAALAIRSAGRGVAGRGGEGRGVAGRVGAGRGGAGRRGPPRQQTPERGFKSPPRPAAGGAGGVSEAERVFLLEHGPQQVDEWARPWIEKEGRRLEQSRADRAAHQRQLRKETGGGLKDAGARGAAARGAGASGAKGTRGDSPRAPSARRSEEGGRGTGPNGRGRPAAAGASSVRPLRGGEGRGRPRGVAEHEGKRTRRTGEGNYPREGSSGSTRRSSVTGAAQRGITPQAAAAAGVAASARVSDPAASVAGASEAGREPGAPFWGKHVLYSASSAPHVAIASASASPSRERQGQSFPSAPAWSDRDAAAVQAVQRRAEGDYLPKVTATPSAAAGSDVLLGRTLEELEQLALSLGQQKYRGKQLHQFMYKNKGWDLAQLEQLPKDVRALLHGRGFRVGRAPVHQVVAAADGTAKVLLRLDDDRVVEAVGIPTEGEMRGTSRLTACISSQVGCPLRCSFCATGKGGFARNLRPHEIVGQVLALEELFGRRVSNLVFMGMGEPLLNLPSLLASVRCLNSDLGIGQRSMTISTVGVPNTIARLAEERLQCTLAVSLHAPNQRLREQLVPSAKAYPMRVLLADCAAYFKKTGRRVSFEYTLLSGVNDQKEHAAELADVLWKHKLAHHVNVIPFNPVDGAPFRRPSKAYVMAFVEELQRQKVQATVRQTRGMEANAACGQLRNAFQKEPLGATSA